MCEINLILEKDFSSLSQHNLEIIIADLVKRLQCEYKKKDRSGIYGITQYEMAYNSNRIEGSWLSEDHTRSLFQTGTIQGDIVFRAKDVEEANGHFKMFNHMLDTYDKPLTQDLIKKYHYELKVGVFEDMANGYPAGEYKIRKNIVGNVKTTAPENVEYEMQNLLDDYNSRNVVTMKELAQFHRTYERIHPFQDGNGRTGRMILFKECLKNNMVPVIIRDKNKIDYFMGLQQEKIDTLTEYFKREQEGYFQSMRDFLRVLEKKKN